jgi:hypothetical protein
MLHNGSQPLFNSTITHYRDAYRYQSQGSPVSGAYHLQRAIAHEENFREQAHYSPAHPLSPNTQQMLDDAVDYIKKDKNK